MADLEKLLLKAAGRTDAGNRNHFLHKQSRRHPQGSYSNDGSDSRDDDSDSDHAYLNRKPSGPQIPLKKRPDSTREEEEEEDYEEELEPDSNDDSVGSDLYKNEHDREQLSRLTELEREMILSERAIKRDDKKLKEVVRSKRSSEKKPKPRKEPPRIFPSSRGVRSSARSADRVSAKDDALNELRAKRLRQQDPDSHQKTRNTSKGNNWRKPPIASDNSSSSVQSENESAVRSEEDDYTDHNHKQTQNENQNRVNRRGKPKPADSDDEHDGLNLPSFEDVRDITIRRSRLEKWLMEPFFDELIAGCFVRVGVGKTRSGPVYRLCAVRNVDASAPYAFGDKTTHKHLNCTWAREGLTPASRLQMTMVSDSSPRKDEFDVWLSEARRGNARVPTKQDVMDKKDSIEQTSRFVYSADTVKRMLQEKKSASARTRPVNVAAEKERLRREMDVAESNGDTLEVERLSSLLKKLEASREESRGRDSKAVRLSEMNKRNRAENFRNASGTKPTKRSGEAGYDPFSRRWTQSMNYYVSKEVGGGVAAAAVPGVETTAAALEAALDAGKLVDTRAPVDLGTESNSLHDFDLPISLARFGRFGGGAQGVQAGFMARKQRIEATMGCRVREDDGRRHDLTLTVSDYKRRRGLL